MRRRWAETVFRRALEDPSVVFIGSDLTPDALFERWARERPAQFFMEGISEAHLIGMAAGMAASGKKVFVNTIATFLTRRAYEQIAIDAAMASLPIRLIGNGGGLVYGPLGPTHLALDDWALMRMLPGMSVIAASDAEELQYQIERSWDDPGPIYFRLGKGGEARIPRAPGTHWITSPASRVLVTTGVMLTRVVAAAELLNSQGHSTSVFYLPELSPSERTLPALEALFEAKPAEIICVEEHWPIGGLGDLVARHLSGLSVHLRPATFKHFCVPAKFPDRYGTQDELLEFYGLSPQAIARRSLLEGSS